MSSGATWSSLPGRTSRDAAAGDAVREAAAWGAGFLATATLILVAGFHSGETDSWLYAEMVVRISSLPVSEWIAPDWWGLWSRDELFREHPIGIFVVPALLARLGLPALQTAYLVNLLYQIACIMLLQRLASRFAPALAARSLGWIILLLPIAFMTRLRANHEPAMLMCLLLALYATYRSQRHAGWAVLTTAALTYAMLVKGALTVFIPLSCVLMLWLHRDRARRAPWLGLLAALVPPLLVAVGYEWAYRQATGESFVVFYAQQWVAIAAEPRGIWPPLRKLLNAGWYLTRYTWYAFPWSLACLAAAWTMRRELLRLVTSPDSLPHDRDGTRLRGLALGLGVPLLYLAALSLSDRTMTRYAFPALFVIGACGGAVAVTAAPRIRRLAERLDRFFPGLQVVVWLLLVALFYVTD